MESALDKKQAFKDKLTEKIGKAKAEVIWEDAKRRLSEIEKQYPSVPKGQQMHTAFIFPAAAMYFAIKDAEGAELAYEVVSACSWDKSRKMGDKLRTMSKIPGFNELFVKLWDPISHKMFGADAGFENVFYPNQPGSFKMDIVKCPYNDYFTELGCPELTRIFCINDECTYGNIPGLDFRRTQTLGKGGEKCDFYISTDKKAVKKSVNKSVTNPMSKSVIYRGIRKDLEKRYGTKKTTTIWNYAGRCLLYLEKKYADESNQHKSFVFPAVAIYRAIEHYAPGEALDITRAYGTRIGLKLKKIISTVTAAPGMPNLIWKKMPLIAKVMSDGYELENVVVDEHHCSMDVVGCHLYDCAKRLKTPEAVQMICCMDKEYMTGIRGVDYKRTKSAAEGDDCCDYRLTDARGKY